MKLAQTLIDKAIEACGGSAPELARRIGCYPADISNLKTGKRALSPEIAAEIADIAGEDARQAVIDAIIERNATNRKGKVLAEILGKGQAVGVAAMLDISYKGDSTIDTATMKNNSNNSNDFIHRIYLALKVTTKQTAHRFRGTSMFFKRVNGRQLGAA